MGRAGSGKHASSAKAVGSFVPQLTRKAFEKYGFSTATLLTDWAAIVGPDLAAVCRPERLKWPRQVDAYAAEIDDVGRPGATLVLRADGAEALTIRYQSRQLLDRINAYFGYCAVSELRLVQAPVAAVAVEDAGQESRRQRRERQQRADSQGQDQDQLSAALSRLAASVAASTTA